MIGIMMIIRNVMRSRRSCTNSLPMMARRRVKEKPSCAGMVAPLSARLRIRDIVDEYVLERRFGLGPDVISLLLERRNRLVQRGLVGAADAQCVAEGGGARNGWVLLQLFHQADQVFSLH